MKINMIDPKAPVVSIASMPRNAAGVDEYGRIWMASANFAFCPVGENGMAVCGHKAALDDLVSLLPSGTIINIEVE